MALVWAAPGLTDRNQVRAAGLRIDHELGDDAPPAWAGEIDQVLVRAGPFAEVEFFHRPSRTLVQVGLIVEDVVEGHARGVQADSGQHERQPFGRVR